MSGNLAGFNAQEHEPQSFDVLPAGTYDVCIVASEMKTTKSGTGRYLQLTLQVLGGEFQNRKLFDRLNLENPNATAVKIAKGTLSAICRAVGVMTPGDSSALHNLPLKAVVKVSSDDSGNPTNEIKGYKPRHTGSQPAPSQPQPAGQIAPPLKTVPSEPVNPF